MKRFSAFFLAGLLATGVACAATAPKPALKVGTLDGKTFDLSAQNGKWVIVNFWATWCSPCIKELPDISAYVDAHKDKVAAIGLAFEDSDKAWVGHVGDSRCYRWRKDALERLTQDHSLVEEQIRIGRMTREQARRSPMQNVITRAVGTRADVQVDIQELPLEKDDLFLIASDGLTRELSDAAIGGILRTAAGDVEKACAALLAAANAAGGHDNITCVLVRAGS